MAFPTPSPPQAALLLEAVSALRRSPDPASRRRVLQAVRSLEAVSPSEQAPVSGRWSLIFSTQEASGADFSTEVEAVGVSPLERLASDDVTASPLQGLNDLAYSIFFKIAPSLAGAVLACAMRQLFVP